MSRIEECKPLNRNRVPGSIERTLREASAKVRKELDTLPDPNDATSENERLRLLATRHRVESRSQALWAASQGVRKPEGALPPLVVARRRLVELVATWEGELEDARAAIDPFEIDDGMAQRRIEELEDSLIAACYYRCYDCGHLTKDPLLGESEDGRTQTAICNECDSDNLQYPGLVQDGGATITPAPIVEHFDWRNFRNLYQLDDLIEANKERITEQLDDVLRILEDMSVEIDLERELGLEPTARVERKRRVKAAPPKPALPNKIPARHLHV